MATKTLNFNTLPAAAPATAPAGYTQTTGSSNVNIVDLSGTKFFAGVSSSSNSIWRDDTVLTGAIRSAFVTTGLTNGSGVGPALLDAGNDGYVALTSDGTGNTRLFLVVDSQLGSQVGSSITKAHADAQVREIRWETGGIISLWDGATQIGSNFTNGTYTPIYAAALSRGGRLRNMESYYLPAQSIDTLTDPLVAGAAFSGTSTGFADGAATLSSNGLSAAVTIASGAFSGTWPIAVDAQPYPTLPKLAQTITLTQGANTATIISDLEPPAGHVVSNWVSPIIDDDTYPAYYVDQDGFTADGGQFVFLPYSDLVMGDDSEVLVTGPGNLVGYFIPPSGTGAGNAYYYTFQISDGGDVITGNRGITAAGLTMSGITMRGITAVGL